MPTSKRGRSRSEEKRRQIIDSAAQLFLEQGFENTSMDTVARLAGVSKQTVYSHFGTKDQLFSSAIESKVDEYQLGPPPAPITEPEQYLRHFCSHLAKLLVSEEALGINKLCISEAGRSNVGQLFWEAGPNKIKQQLSHFLEHQCQTGFLQIDNIDTACTQLIAMLHGEQHLCAVMGLNQTIKGADADRQLEDYAQSCATMFLGCYRKP